MIRYHFLAKGFCFGRSVSGASRFIRMGNHSHSEEVNGSEKLEFDFTGLKEHNLRKTTKKVVSKSVIPGQSNELFSLWWKAFSYRVLGQVTPRVTLLICTKRKASSIPRVIWSLVHIWVPLGSSLH